MSSDESKPKLYIGQKLVTEYNEVESGVIDYVFEDNSRGRATMEQFDSMVKDKPYDDGMARVYKWGPAVREIMAVLLKNNMMMIEKDFVMGRVDETIIQRYAEAAAKLFGSPSENEITLTKIHEVLVSGETGEDQA